MSAKEYFIKRDKAIRGPFDQATIKKLILDDKLRSSDKIATSKAGPWKAAGLVSGSSNHTTAPEASQKQKLILFIRDPFTENIDGPLSLKDIKVKLQDKIIDNSWEISNSPDGSWKKIADVKGLDLKLGDSKDTSQKAERPIKQITPASMRQFIQDFDFEDTEAHFSFSVFPDIPKKKLKAASEFGAAPLRPDEEILFVYENTVFGNPKKGIAWTTHAIHASGDNGKKTFILADILSLDVVEKDSETETGQLQVDGIGIYDEGDFKFLISNFSPLFAKFRMEFIASDEEIELTQEEQRIYVQLATQTGDWLEEERRRMAKNTVCWNSNRSLTPTEVSNKIINNELTKVGIPYPQIEDLINANLEPDETIQFVIAGIGVNTLCFTNQSIMIVNEMVDTERSNPGTAGEIKGAMAGHLVGQGIGNAIGSQFGITGMIVGGLLGSAAGLLAGSEAGKALSRNILTNVNTTVLPYSSIKRITAGQRNIDENNSCPVLTFISSEYPEPVDFVFDKELQPFTTPLLSEMKKSVAKLSNQDKAIPANASPAIFENKDPLERMKMLKTMHEEGLISEEEFERKKNLLLEQL